MGVQNDSVTLEVKLVVSYKIIRRLTIRSNIQIFWFYYNELKTMLKHCTQMFIATLLIIVIIVKTWKQLKCSFVGE